MTYPQQQLPYGPPTGFHYPPPQVLMIQSPPTSGAAVAALVFGILGLFLGWCLFAIPCVLAVVCGHVGVADTKDGTRTGRGMAVTGLILGYLLIGPVVAVIMLGGAGVGAVLGLVDSAPTP